ncbi:hypothetical protein ACFWOY_31775 [Streptomyces sp. NPDC058423]|uniref:hypothetical protein n=1 Tax=unclassified Streptomyces TaxID=2593676 RepID=UPI00365AB430
MLFRHLSMACSVSMASVSMNVNIDIRRNWGVRFMEHVDVAVIGGGQSGVAAACALRERGLMPVVPEASEKPAGSWPHCRLAFFPRRGAALRCRPADAA